MPKTLAAKKKVRLDLDISVTAPKPNPRFSEWEHTITRFLTYSRPVKCAHCGKKKRNLWTCLKFFRVVEMEPLVAVPSPTEYPPLTPICSDHCFQPVM